MCWCTKRPKKHHHPTLLSTPAVTFLQVFIARLSRQAYTFPKCWKGWGVSFGLQGLFQNGAQWSHYWTISVDPCWPHRVSFSWWISAQCIFKKGNRVGNNRPVCMLYMWLLTHQSIFKCLLVLQPRLEVFCSVQSLEVNPACCCCYHQRRKVCCLAEK